MTDATPEAITRKDAVAQAREAVLSDVCPECGHSASWHGENHDDGCDFDGRCGCGLNAKDCYSSIDNTGKVDALITAARAAGAAEERARECRWTWDAAMVSYRRPCCDAFGYRVPLRCPNCGGKVRVVEQEGENE